MSLMLFKLNLTIVYQKLLIKKNKIMNHLAFVLWICLWPVAVSLDSYLTAKKRKIQGKEQVEIKDVALPTLIIWIAIAVLLY